MSARADVLEFIEPGPDGASRVSLSVPDAYCATCIQTIEKALLVLPGVRGARVNLDRRQVQIDFDPASDPSGFEDAVTRSGYRNHPIDPQAMEGRDPALRELVSALVVAGFASAHTMFFSEAVWSGVEGDARTLFYWLSALVAVPAVAFAGRPFFRSAYAALRAGKANMDVPIAIALIATTAISLLETRLAGQHAYFDASTMLLFFLLVGRTLDHVMRAQARAAVSSLARLAPRGAQRFFDDGSVAFVRLAEIVPGMRLLLRAGDRVPVDCAAVDSGAVDMSVVNGEAMPLPVVAGDALPAGALVVDRPIAVTATRPAIDSFVARTAALMESAESARTRYRRIADRAADLYAPLVHLAAALTFLFWIAAGAGWHTALLNAVAVLIVTCPCALALAVPIAHVVAAGRLFAQGVLMKDGAALERLATVRHVAFDKTGTLTSGRPVYAGEVFGSQESLSMARAMAAASNHPLSLALASGGVTGPLPPDCREVPGGGVEARIEGQRWRLGSASFCGAADDGAGERSRVWLSNGDTVVACFEFEDILRPDAASTLCDLQQASLEVSIVSGDRSASVRRVASALGIERAAYALTPSGKLETIEALRRGGPVAMVGDGINDAVALRGADVSFAPASAADVGRAAADFVLTSDRLAGVPFALWLARMTDTIVRQNLAISMAYNLVVLPMAAAGLVTPLVAAIAMSSSSMIVVLNALRLRFTQPPRSDIK
ncbi:cadmium-translocating P-type ATPase [Devosia oryziradicis]|uniref:Cadmium-translocating P-type ATPase n=1 Tax=Devosia oryziradicis TaxID=2801335 RepID=A0ABX7BYU5_9HYPH|nr:heavy metal translocating P-type ATPase [Devosia oryziradicis]QQR36194.1 cadmium-translocating P-type ATPase [Devosia oryziradicis]